MATLREGLAPMPHHKKASKASLRPSICRLCMVLLLWISACSSVACVEQEQPDSSGFSIAPVPAFDIANIPWLAPSAVDFKYTGLQNNLEGLLNAQASMDRCVTVFVFNSAVTRFAINSIYSFIKYGNGINYIVAAADDISLEVCGKYRLPCHNASYMVDHKHDQSTDPILFGNPKYMAMVWGKVKLVHKVLHLGYSVHFSDVDVVYMRPVWSSYNSAMSRIHADAVFMAETSGFNTGVYVIRNNNRTLRMVDAWLAAASVLDNDQRVLNGFVNKTFKLCTSEQECESAKDDDLAAVYRHPEQFSDDHCPLRSPTSERHYDAMPCHPMRLFVHGICMTNWSMQRGKGHLFERYKLWLVDAEGRPLWSDEHDVNKRHPFLPCRGNAWLQLPSRVIGHNHSIVTAINT